MENVKHNLNNIVIDRVLRGIFSSNKTGDIIFALNQVQNLSINATSESQEVLDAMGVSIMELMRSKALEVSAENAIYDMSLASAQYGADKTLATSAKKLIVPTMESFEVSEGKTYTLKHTPVADPVAIYALNNDSTLGAKFDKDTNATTDKFAYADGTLTLPTNAVVGSEMFVMYEYESENAAEVINSANKFAKMGKMTFEVLVHDVCDPESMLLAYIVLPRFQLSNDFDWSIGGDSQTHPFSGKANVDYCAKDKAMMKIVIVDDEEE